MRGNCRAGRGYTSHTRWRRPVLSIRVQHKHLRYSCGACCCCSCCHSWSIGCTTAWARSAICIICWRAVILRRWALVLTVAIASIIAHPLHGAGAGKLRGSATVHGAWWAPMEGLAIGFCAWPSWAELFKARRGAIKAWWRTIVAKAALGPCARPGTWVGGTSTAARQTQAWRWTPGAPRIVLLQHAPDDTIRFLHTLRRAPNGDGLKPSLRAGICDLNLCASLLSQCLDGATPVAEHVANHLRHHVKVRDSIVVRHLGDESLFLTSLLSDQLNHTGYSSPHLLGIAGDLHDLKIVLTGLLAHVQVALGVPANVLGSLSAWANDLAN
mmetsp:Transcript_20251/g.34821  ORF Transcript_20251/g.34821 Transcript_20251/m.34821 type:complete len:327 (-) Transcript_20251:115-1095(-)